ncbi:MAG: YSIRK-type signal peptide-containing protein [Lactobacillus sp.]
MFGKSTRNNKFAIISKQVPRYGLRKFNFGVASVLLGTTIFMGGAMTTQVKAETVAPDQQSQIEMVSKDTNSAANKVATDQTTTEQNEQAEKSEIEEAKDPKSNSNELNKDQAPAEQKKQNENTAPETKAEEIPTVPDKSKKASQANDQEKLVQDQDSEQSDEDDPIVPPYKPTFKVVKNPRDVVYKGHTYHLEGQMYKYKGYDVYGNDIFIPASDEEVLDDFGITSTDPLSSDELKKLGLRPNEFISYSSKGVGKMFIDASDTMVILQNDYGQIVITNIVPVHNPDGTVKTFTNGGEIDDALFSKYVFSWADSDAGGHYVIDPANPRFGYTSQDLNKTITRTINVHNPDGTTTTTTQEVHYSRTGLYDMSFEPVYDAEGHVINVKSVNTRVGYDNNEDGIPEYTVAQGNQAWQTSKNSFDEFTVPDLNGYRPSMVSINSETVTPETADSVIDVTYTELKHDTGEPLVDTKPAYDLDKLKKHETGDPLVDTKLAYDLKQNTDEPEQTENPSVKPEVPPTPDTNETTTTDTSTDEPEQEVTPSVKAENPTVVSTKKASEKQAPSENVAPKPITVAQPNQKSQATIVKTAVVKAQNNQQASEKLPQTGSDHEVANLLSVLGITLLSGLGLIWLSRKKEN